MYEKLYTVALLHCLSLSLWCFHGNTPQDSGVPHMVVFCHIVIGRCFLYFLGIGGVSNRYSLEDESLKEST